MTLQSLHSPMYWPGVTPAVDAAITLASNQTLDAAGEYDAAVFMAREAMTISHVGFRNSTATGSPTVDVRIETVGADGIPTGTLWATNTNIVTGALSANTTSLHALTASASITAGQFFCVKIAYNSGTSVIIQRLNNLFENGGIPYAYFNVGTPTKAAFIARPWILGSGATTFYRVEGLYSLTAITANTFNNSTHHSQGMRFQIPFKCRAIGISHTNSTATGNFDAVMYDDSSNELSSSSTSFDGDQMAAAAEGINRLYFDNPVTLSPATFYRAALVPTSATNIGLASITVSGADYRAGWPHGTNTTYSTRATGPGSWTDTTTQLPIMDIIIDQLDDGAGAGAPGHANMAGGLLT